MSELKGKRAEIAIKASDGFFKTFPLKCSECGGVYSYDEHDDIVCETCGLVYE